MFRKAIIWGHPLIIAPYDESVELRLFDSCLLSLFQIYNDEKERTIHSEFESGTRETRADPRGSRGLGSLFIELDDGLVNDFGNGDIVLGFDHAGQISELIIKNRNDS